jgi:hypothetical protein
MNMKSQFFVEKRLALIEKNSYLVLLPVLV